MYKFKPIEIETDKQGLGSILKAFVFKLGSTAEWIIILIVWAYLLSSRVILKDFTREEIITYIIAGGIIALLTRYLVYRAIEHELYNKYSEILLYRPFSYLKRVLTHSLGMNLLSFLAALLFHVLILYLFRDSFISNFKLAPLFIIILMILLAFVIEFLIAYLVKMYIFQIFEAKEFFSVLVRLKRILAGNYFPLSLLPTVFVELSLVLPFAYSFFVPAEIYLEKISIQEGLMGLGIQLLWIIILYGTIKIIWQRRVRSGKIES